MGCDVERCWGAGEESAHMADRLQPCARDNGEGHYRQSMTMDYGLHVGAPAVDFPMDEAFEEQLGALRWNGEIAVEVKLDDFPLGDERGGEVTPDSKAIRPRSEERSGGKEWDQ